MSRVTTLAPALRPFELAAPLYVAAPDTQRLARRWVRLALVLTLAAHIFLISAGFWSFWPQYTARNRLLANAFAAGQTNLLIHANPRHLALPDPYDPVANHLFRQLPGIPDSCLYNGKFYLYWGPVPALLLLPINYLMGPTTIIGDQYLCFAFVEGMMVATAAILLRLWSRHFRQAPVWTPALGVMVCGLSTPITCVLTRAAVYEVAIVGGQCFLLAGIYFAWRAVGATARSPSSSRNGRGLTPQLLLLAFGGGCLSLAVGCRVSLAVAVTAIGLFVVCRLIFASRRAAMPFGRLLLELAAFGLPLVAGAAALCGYNQVRFGSPLEFGQQYQLAAVNLHSYGGLFGAANLWPGLWSYFLRPVAVISYFPFIVPVSGEGFFPSFIHLPPHYESYEAITGIVWVMPFLWFVPLAAIQLVISSFRRRASQKRPLAQNPTQTPVSEVHRSPGFFGFRKQSALQSLSAIGVALPSGNRGLQGILEIGGALPSRNPGLRSTSETGVCLSRENPGVRDLQWLTALLLAAACLGFMPVLLMIGSAQRYLVDFTPSMMVVAMIGVWTLSQSRGANTARGRRFTRLSAIIAAVTMLVGVLISVEGYSGHFRYFNPDLLKPLTGDAVYPTGPLVMPPATQPVDEPQPSAEKVKHADN